MPPRKAQPGNKANQQACVAVSDWSLAAWNGSILLPVAFNYFKKSRKQSKLKNAGFFFSRFVGKPGRNEAE